MSRVRDAVKTLTGCAAVLLGAVGVLLCAAACGGAWWASFKIATGVERGLDRADEGIVALDRALARAAGRVSSATSAVEQVRNSVDANDSVPKARIDALLDEVDGPLDRIEAQTDVLRALGAVLENVSDAAVVGSARSVRIRSAADRLATASDALDSIRERVAALRAQGAERGAQEIAV